MKKMILSSLSKSINTCLHLDPESKERIKPLHGKTIGIEFLPLHFSLLCTFNENGIQLLSDEIMDVETTIRGTPLQMAGVMIDKKNRQRFFADDLSMEGNAELGQQVVELFDRLQIDWEEYLSRIVGDIPAHHAGRLVSKFKGWLTDSGNDFCEDLGDYLQEETKYLPSRESLNDFFSEIDLVRMDVDRMEARVAHLIKDLNEEETK
jgi:ubiquinone biosynthesis protein UbiJ